MEWHHTIRSMLAMHSAICHISYKLYRSSNRFPFRKSENHCRADSCGDPVCLAKDKDTVNDTRGSSCRDEGTNPTVDRRMCEIDK